jgi:hypothetical protein
MQGEFFFASYVLLEIRMVLWLWQDPNWAGFVNQIFLVNKFVKMKMTCEDHHAVNNR